MAKIKRFYLLIAALIYSKSYYSAYALTSEECSMAAWLFDRAMNVDCDAYSTITCDNSEVVQTTVYNLAQEHDSNYADFWESWGHEIMACTLHGYGQQPAASTFFDCDKMQNLGCYDHSSGDTETEVPAECISKGCNGGYGLDPVEGCMKCDGGQYVKNNQTVESEMGDCWIGPICADCPGYYAEDGTYIDAYTSTNDEPGSTIRSCFISNSDLWEFSDATGAGYKNFSHYCYYGS